MDSKILMVGWSFPPEIEGGLDIHVANLFQELRELGVDVDLLLPEEKAPDREDVITVNSGEDTFSRARDLGRKAVEAAGEYDVIHTHDWLGTEAGLKSRKYRDTRWVATFHSLVSNRTRNPSRRIENLERAMAERSDSSVAVSRSLADAVEDRYGRRPEVVHNGFSDVSGNGSDIKEELGVDGDMVFFVGRHAEQKGVEHLIYGFSKLTETRDATLVIGGEGHMTGALERFVELLDMEDQVIFTGFIPEDELGDYYSSADVFVSPSINEPFGLTVTEALQAGTPVVATESGAEEILPGDAIVKVEPDSGSIKKGIEEALDRSSPPEPESRSWEEVAEEIREIYRDL